ALDDGRRRGSLSFFTDPARALDGAKVIFLCVQTPNRPDGTVDLSAVVAATGAVARHAIDGSVLVNRTTAPVGTAQYLQRLLALERGGDVAVAVNPEFLAEGTAVRDFL